MVRINIIHPHKLSDQHLIAEYVEILMLLGYVKKNPKINDIPESYRLGRGHIKFFKNKLIYLKNRHEIIKKEMNKRNFKTEKNIDLRIFPKNLLNDWKPQFKDEEIIKDRIIQKIILKPYYYRYFGEKKDIYFFQKLLK